MLIRYIFRSKLRVFAFLLIIICAPIVQSVSTYLSASMMDAAADSAYNEFLRLLLIIFILFLIHGVLLFFRQAVQASIVSSAREQLKQDMFHDIINTNYSFFSIPDTGYHIAAFSNDISMLEYRYFEAWMELIFGIVTLITVSVAVVNINGQLAALIIIGNVGSILLCLLLRDYSSRMNGIYLEKLALFTQRIKDYFSAFPAIRNFSAESSINRRFNILNHDTEYAKNDGDIALSFVNTLAQVCNSFIKFLLVGIGVVMMIQGDMTFGLIYAAYQFHDQMVSPMHTLISKSNEIGSVRQVVKRIEKVAQVCKREANICKETAGAPITIELKDVSLTLGKKDVLSKISYTFRPGGKYLIIGKNGAGKSQLLQLLKRSRERYTGEILVNGRTIRDIPFASLSEAVSYINESVSLFCDSVENNITLYRKTSKEELLNVVHTVGLSVPLERRIRDGDRNISSGEARRIEIARSLLRKAQVIVFDEAISTLDIPTAYSIEKMLLNLSEQTVLFVSHNFSGKLLDQYDGILLIENGKLIASGTHQELMRQSPYYRHLMMIKNGKS